MTTQDTQPVDREAAHAQALESVRRAVASVTCHTAQWLGEYLSEMKTDIDAMLHEDGLGQCVINMRNGVVYVTVPTHYERYPFEVLKAKFPPCMRWVLRRDGVHEMTVRGLT